jgi:hypothetical protein
MTAAVTYPATWTLTAMCVEFDAEPPCDVTRFDDGTVRVAGALPPGDQEALLRTHVEGGLDADGRVIWHPKEAGDDS